MSIEFISVSSDSVIMNEQFFYGDTYHITDVLVDGGDVVFAGGAYGENIRVTNEGEVDFEEGGCGNNITVTSTGGIEIEDNTSVTNISIEAGGWLNDFQLNSALTIADAAAGFVIDGASVEYDEEAKIFAGQTARNITLRESAQLKVYDGSTLENTTFTASTVLEITGIGTLKNITVTAGSYIVFNMNNRQESWSATVAAIADWASINGAASANYELDVIYTAGTYKLASNAAGFNSDIKVLGDDDAILGTLTLAGATVSQRGLTYSIRKDGGDLYLDVVAGEGYVPPPVKPPVVFGDVDSSDIDGNGISDVMFQYVGGNYQLGFWMNGTSEWKSQSKAEPQEWEVLGAYDMDSSGKADAVLVGNVTVDGIKGAFIGYYKDADTSKWENISYLTNADNIDWKNKVGNLTGNAGKNSIVWHAAELGALGVWTDGTDNWKSIDGYYGTGWELLGTGDFDGNGKDEVLLGNSGAFYSVDIDNNFTSLGSAGSGWEVRAVGDFFGDGKDDIVIFHEDTGLMACLDNGMVGNWFTVGQLDAADWFVVGAGEYNGYGADDLLVRQYSTGMLGYYADCTMELWQELGRGVDMDWTVIA